MYIERDYLAHHGIKGMKWGVRRYQNEDGTLTGAGKSRYNDGDGGFKFGEHAGSSNSSGSNNLRVSRSAKADKANTKSTKMTPDRKKALAKKIAIGVGVTAVAAAAAYVTSKHLKSKATSLIDQSANKKISQMMREYDFRQKHLDDAGVRNIQRMDFNVRANHVLKKANSQRSAVNNSTWEAIKYLRGR